MIPRRLSRGSALRSISNLYGRDDRWLSGGPFYPVWQTSSHFDLPSTFSLRHQHATHPYPPPSLDPVASIRVWRRRAVSRRVVRRAPPDRRLGCMATSSESVGVARHRLVRIVRIRRLARGFGKPCSTMATVQFGVKGDDIWVARVGALLRPTLVVYASRCDSTLMWIRCGRLRCDRHYCPSRCGRTTSSPVSHARG